MIICLKQKNNKIIYSRIENINSTVSEYVNKYHDADVDKQLEIVDWMDKISLQIYYLIDMCTELIRKQMSNILFIAKIQYL